ncbi:hypothetical protein CHS0354_022675 [Potamilus streckersoni]|uniref:Uncharacterized protein n=1 Tax=Potamilus streckersoni TaxID=2493646 RepID=A0AAE0VQ78_9BIVA|nr:hypothetical protein CHS0354_022675 [Potamilus streckersoni]
MYSAVRAGSLLFVLGLLYMVSSAVVWDETQDCPIAKIYCHCVNQFEIDCSGRNLSRIPYSGYTTWSYRVIDLRNNQITRLSKSDFNNINVSEILLDNNYISSIENDTFQNLRNDLRLLDLEHNQLTYLPPELGTLGKLEFLDLRENNIPSIGFNDMIMRQMGDYMRKFYFGHMQLDEWPLSIRHFQQLRQLELYGGIMSQLPVSAFQGFEWTITDLSIRNTKLISVPIALQDLHNVETFHFDDNTLVGDAGILAPAFAGMVKSVKTLTLENDSLTDFPDILLTLQTVQSLSLARNKLEFVSDASVRKIASPNLTNLNLEECDLDRIPGALSQLTSLLELDLSKNRIHTIERNDLQQLYKMLTLSFNNNPVAYVSNSSFGDLFSLQRLEMRNTNLILVPEAIRNMPHLQMVDFSGPTPVIECNCQHMIWLYNHLLSNNRLIVQGECETIAVSIQDYARVRVPQYCNP